MSKAAAISRDFLAEARTYYQSIASSAIVLASGAALILAGQPLPL